MKTTKYKASKHFEAAQIQRPYLTLENCAAVIDSPLKMIQQDDGRFVFWGEEQGTGRFLRVVTEADKLEVITAFRDRRFKL